MRRTIARYSLVEKDLSKSLLDLTNIGKLVLTNRRGMPVMTVNHIHVEECEVKAHTRPAYDKISVDKL